MGWKGWDPPPTPLMDAGPVNRGLCWNRFCLLLQIAAAAALFKGWKVTKRDTKISVLVQEATKNFQNLRICVICSLGLHDLEKKKSNLVYFYLPYFLIKNWWECRLEWPLGLCLTYSSAEGSCSLLKSESKRKISLFALR